MRESIGDAERYPFANFGTNTHTFFFREKEAIEMIRERILIPRALRGERTAIWSAGCATGEEPFSLAIVAREAAASVEILATDINPHAIARARSAIWPERRLRMVSKERRARWFHPRPEGHEARPSLKETVRFFLHDVANEVSPSPSRRSSESSGWDVIFCRNVLLYFDEETKRRALDRLTQALLPGGVLVLGGSEWLSTKIQNQMTGDILALTDMGGVLCYERAARPKLSATSWSPPPKALSPRLALPRPASSPSSSLRPPSKPLPGAARKPDRAGLVRRLRYDGDAALDAGRLSDALDDYSTALELEPLAADLHLRAALCHMRREGGEEAARSSLRRSLFIAPNLWPAALMLGDLLERSEPDAALRYFIYARNVLIQTAGAHLVAEDDPAAPFMQNAEATLNVIVLRIQALAELIQDRKKGRLGG
jgi:chemotaxis protein methyltransferase CheR